MKNRVVKRVVAGVLAGVTLLAMTGCGASASNASDDAASGKVLGERAEAVEETAEAEDAAGETEEAEAAKTATDESKKITVGVCAGPYGDMFEDCITPSLEELGYEVEIIEISDIVTPNTEWVTSPLSRGSSQPMDQTQVSCI